MKKTTDFQDFVNEFKAYNRQDNFSIDGLRALFEYCEYYEQETGEEWELDVVAFCCDFTESDIDSIASDHGIDLSDCIDLDEQFNVVLDFLERETVVIYSDEKTGAILYANFKMNTKKNG